MKNDICILWFRSDLRIHDNPALVAAAKYKKVVPVYILDDCAPAACKLGEASKVWLHHSLIALNKSLGGKLNLYKGSAESVLQTLVKKHKACAIFCNECFEPWHSKQTKHVEAFCKKASVDFKAFNGNYLFHPTELLKDDKTFYKVYTPYKKKALATPTKKTVSVPGRLSTVKDAGASSIEKLGLLPKRAWKEWITSEWNIGEEGARKKLGSFMQKKLSGYKAGRDFPYKDHTSKLSPHLHFGEISPTTILEKVQQSKAHSDKDTFISELLWREFSVYLLYHFPQLYEKNFNKKFDKFPWTASPKLLKAWQKGRTGYPYIDAAMTELWKTGYMHNRARMAVASFLVKNLNVHWHKGRDWFWDCLVDADLANNSASWQWVAGSGVDAAPFFRIFNPITQGEKFDKEGEYVKKWLPELKKIPAKYIHKPWMAPDNILEYAGVELGKTYPMPIVEVAATREKALKAFHNL